MGECAELMLARDVKLICCTQKPKGIGDEIEMIEI